MGDDVVVVKVGASMMNDEGRELLVVAVNIGKVRKECSPGVNRMVRMFTKRCLQ